MCTWKNKKEQLGKSAVDRASCSFEYGGQRKPLRWTFEQKLEGVEGNKECGHLEKEYSRQKDHHGKAC